MQQSPLGKVHIIGLKLTNAIVLFNRFLALVRLFSLHFIYIKSVILCVFLHESVTLETQMRNISWLPLQ
jgi:hypothetical protein